MSNDFKLCIHCATGECQFRYGIRCMSWICARDNPSSGGQFDNETMSNLFSVFGIKPGDPTYDSLMKGQ